MTAAKPIVLPNAGARRFWARVLLPDETGCMLWTGSLRRGYGQITTGGRNLLANRIACMLAHGPAPTPEHEAAHSCRNKHCVAPAHLSWKTPLGNALDRVRDETLVRGERAHRAKLTEAMALEILGLTDDRTHRDIARDYDVSRSAISSLLRGVSWKHLPRVQSHIPRKPRVRRKLTDTDVLEILNHREMTQDALAKKYGVSQSIISRIRAGTSWKHLSREAS